MTNASMRIGTRFIALSSIALLAGASSVVHAQTGFAGTITFAMHSRNGSDQTLVQIIKGNKLRIEGIGGSSRGGGGIIVDAGAKTTTILMNDQKMYMQITADDMKNAADRVKEMLPPDRAQSQQKAPPTTRPTSDVKVTNTGRTETVAGVSCDVYRVTDTKDGKPNEGEVCMGKGVGFAPFEMMGGMGAAMMGRNAPRTPDMSAFTELMKDNRGVLKVTTIEGGKPFVELEATKIDRSIPGDDLFTVPPGFTKFQMPNIPGLTKPRP